MAELVERDDSVVAGLLAKLKSPDTSLPSVSAPRGREGSGASRRRRPSVVHGRLQGCSAIQADISIWSQCVGSRPSGLVAMPLPPAAAACCSHFPLRTLLLPFPSALFAEVPHPVLAARHRWACGSCSHAGGPQGSICSLPP